MHLLGQLQLTYCTNVHPGNGWGEVLARLRRYLDLQDSLERIHDPSAREWRVHFHVPIFVESYGAFRSTQDAILETFALLREEACSEELDIETYSWEVLPDGLRRDLQSSIPREYRWVLDVL